MKDKIILICEKCLSRNYTIKKTASGGNTRMEIKKYCPRCNQHTIHRETK